jgi:8-oxo-dGTP pyrophosphatase MutT (NUDIX family)
VTVAPAPIKEIGYTHVPNSYNYWMFDEETTPELVWPQSIAVYDAMRRQDAQCASVLRAVTLPVRRTPWRIDPNGARDEVVKLVAEDLGLPIVGEGEPDPLSRTRDRFSWPEHLRQALLMLVHGHSYFEQVYRVDGDGNRARLRKLAPRPAKTIEEIKVAEDGGLIYIKQYAAAGEAGTRKPIPVDRLVGYVHDREGGNWLGSSLLRPAFKHWLIKDRLLRVQAQTIERNGMGIPLYTGPENPDADDLSKGLGLATSWRAGEASGSAIPHTASLKLVGVEGTLPDAQPAINYHDSQIARAVLAHFLNLGTQTGSWALGTTFADFFTLSLQTLAQQIADTATMHVIEDLVDANWGPDEPAPRLVFDEIGSRQAATAQALKSLIDAGAIQLDGTLEEMLRQQYGLPPRSGNARERGDADDQEDDRSVDADALSAAIETFLSGGDRVTAAAAKWNPALHPRGRQGRFRTTFDRLLDALGKWQAAGGKGDPFKDFKEREPLRRAAVKQGIILPRGASRDDIAKALLSHIQQGLSGKPSAAPAKKAAGTAPGGVAPKASPPAATTRLSQLSPAQASQKGALEVHSVQVQGRGNVIGEVRKVQRGSITAWQAHDIHGNLIGSYQSKRDAQDAVTTGQAGTAGTPAKKVSRRVAGVAGVTSTEIPAKQPPPGSASWMTPAKQSLDIHFNGVWVGSIHERSYGWTADTPTGNPAIGAGRAKTSAIQALVAHHQSRATLRTGVPGATLGRRPQVFGTAPDHYEVEYQGVDIGDIHGDESDPAGDWHAFPPANAGYVLQGAAAGKYTTKDLAVRALVDAHNQHNAPPPPSAPASAPAAVAPPVITTRRLALGGPGSPGYDDHVIMANGTDIGVAMKTPAGYTVHPTNQTGLPNPLPGGPFMTKTHAVHALTRAYTATLAPAGSGSPTVTLQRRGPSDYDVTVNGLKVGAIQRQTGQTGQPWRAFPNAAVPGAPQMLPGRFGSRKDALDALVAATSSYHSPPPPPVPAPAAPAASAPEVKAAQDVLYGIDPKAKTTARQLAVYGALRKAHFDTLDTAEQSTLLGDLSYIATTSKGPNAVRAQKLLDRFTPAGTAPGTVPPQAVIPPAGAVSAQTRVTDPTGTPGMFSVLPAAKRGQSGDGWTRTAAGGSGPWGQYGAAGLLLRHVDATNGEERFLMIQRGPGISNPGEWQFPGGAKDEHEDFYQGAAREVIEELGFKAADLDSARVHGTHTHEAPGVTVPGIHGGQVPWAYVSIAATVDRQLVPDLSTHHARMETSDAQWMTIAEIEALDRKGKLLRPLAGGQLQQNVMSLFPTGPAVRPKPTTKRPPRLTGTPTVKTPHKPSRGKDLVSDTTARDKLRQDVKHARKKYSGKAADDRLAAIAEIQGFDDTPTVMTKAEIDRLLATGDYIEVWRGVSGTYGKTARQIQEELRSGPVYFGHGIFGNGYYFTADRAALTRNWNRYTDGTPGSVVRALIPRTAHTIQFNDARSAAHRIAQPYSRAKGRQHEDGTLYDEGRYAAARGYDMIEVPHGTSQASHVTAPGKSTWVIINRSVLIIEEDTGRNK